MLNMYFVQCVMSSIAGTQQVEETSSAQCCVFAIRPIKSSFLNIQHFYIENDPFKF